MGMNGLLGLSLSDLAALQEAMRSGRLSLPYLPSRIERIVPHSVASDVAADLQDMVASGANREGLVAALQLLSAARSKDLTIDEIIELVTTGPDGRAVGSRDTQVIVQDLFRNAERSVLVAGYELSKSASVFRTLADRMATEPRPTVQMFLNVKRGFGDTSADSELIGAFARRFRTNHWPADRPVPEIYFDPRSLAMDVKRRAVLHAKCVVVDRKVAFVSSANFTEVAQERNIEVGVLVRSAVVSERLISFFAALVSSGAVERAM